MRGSSYGTNGVFALPPGKNEFNVPRTKLVVSLREARNVVLGRFFVRFKFQGKELRSSVSRESAYPSWKEDIVFEESASSDGAKDSPARSLKALGQRSVRIAQDCELEVVMVRKSKWGADHEVGMVRLDLAKTRRAENWFMFKTQARIMGDDAEASAPEVLLWIEFQFTQTERAWYRRSLHDFVLKKMRLAEEEKRVEEETVARLPIEDEEDEGEYGYPLDLGYEDGVPLVTADMFAAYRRNKSTFYDQPEQAVAQPQDALESVYNRDWELNELLQFNARFQQAVDVLNSSSETEPNQVLAAARSLITVAQDFLFSAKTYGKIIISERFLPDDKKTIKPQSVGGKIGGIKYVHAGVFYKFALPDGSIVTSVEEAAKVAGFRLIAITVLPIGKHTLVGGTSDAGRNIHSSDPGLNNKLAKAAQLLNLKPHVVRGHTVYSACDLEGHFNKADGRHYLLDFSRVMPPAAPKRSRSSRRSAATIFVEMLRPEFVSKYRIPLCSDAFSGFRDKSNKQRDEKDIARACKDLGWLIPRFAAELSELVEQKVQQEDMLSIQSSLSRLLHSKGINMRHLGSVFSEASSHTCRMLLLIEMVSRSVKVLCRKRMRHLMETLTYPLEQPYIEATVQLLNAVFGGDDHVWKQQILPYIGEYFGVVFGGVGGNAKPLQPSKTTPSQEGGNDNNAEKSNTDVYDELGSSQGSLSSSGVSEKNQIAPRITKDSAETAAPPLASASASPVHVADDSGEDDEEQQQQHLPLPEKGFLASLRSALFTKKPAPVVNAAVLPVYDSILDPAPALPPPRVDDPFAALHSMPSGMSLLLKRLVAQLGLRFSERVERQIEESLSQRVSAVLLTKRRAFEVSDLQELGERVKPLNIVPEAQGYLFVNQAKQQLTVQDELHYYQLAANCFNDALAGNTVSRSVLRAYADVLMDTEMALGHATLDGRSPTARRIAELYREALRISADDWMVLRQYGIFLTKCGQFEDAKLAFLQSIQVCPNQEAVQRYCSLLGGNSEEANEMVEAWELFRSKNAKN